MDIRRHDKLKSQSLLLAERLKRENPLFSRSITRVSNTGLTYTDLAERLDKINSCSSIVELREDWQQGPGGLEQVLSIAAANYCKQHIVCPMCADRLQSRRRAIYDQPIREQVQLYQETIERKNNGTFVRGDKLNRYAYLVTYTIVDGPNLAERLDHLKQSRRDWRRMGQKRDSGRSQGEASKIVAGASTIEVKRGKNSEEWHVHAHELMFTNEELDYTIYDPDARAKLRKKYGNNIPKEQLDEIAMNRSKFQGEMVATSKLSREWLHATGGDSISIHCAKLVHVPRQKLQLRNGKFQWVNISAKTRKRLMRMNFIDSIAYQSKEALKYMTKPADLTPIDALTVIEDTYNKRMTATYGQFRRINKRDEYNEETTDQDSTYVVVWDKKRKEYGKPIPGKLRDVIDLELEHHTRSLAGKITGVYRRDRRALLKRRELYGGTLCTALDDLKQQYRAQINGIWKTYQQSVTSATLIDYADCDNYSPVLATRGLFLPGSDSRDSYIAAFS